MRHVSLVCICCPPLHTIELIQPFYTDKTLTIMNWTVFNTPVGNYSYHWLSQWICGISNVQCWSEHCPLDNFQQAIGHLFLPLDNTHQLDNFKLDNFQHHCWIGQLSTPPWASISTTGGPDESTASPATGISLIWSLGKKEFVNREWYGTWVFPKSTKIVRDLICHEWMSKDILEVKHCQRHNGPRVLSLKLESCFWLKSIWNYFGWKRSFKIRTQYPGPWVRCASGNVFSSNFSQFFFFFNFHLH